LEIGRGYILENTPLPRGKYQPMSFGEKYEKAKRKKVKMSNKKEEREEKMGSKRVKQMQNREELRRKVHDGS
jgi:hypothetical protein